jgi:hypothetical protein
MTPAELISKVLSGPEGEWTSTRWGDGLQILEAFHGDHDFAADAIGVLLERVDAMEHLARGFRHDAMFEAMAKQGLMEGFAWTDARRLEFIAEWEAETERLLKGGDA